MSKGEIRVAIISIPNILAGQHALDFKKILGKYMFDENVQFSILFDKTLKAFLNVDETFDLKKQKETLLTMLKT